MICSSAVAAVEAALRAAGVEPELRTFSESVPTAAAAAVVDPDLAQFGVLWAGGGDKYTMFATNFEELVAMTAGTVIPVA